MLLSDYSELLESESKRLAPFFKSVPTHTGGKKTLSKESIYVRHNQPAQANPTPPADTVEADQSNPIQARGELATKINRAIVDFGNSEYYLKHREGTQKQLILDWLNQQGFNGRQQDVIKTLISEHYNIKSK